MKQNILQFVLSPYSIAVLVTLGIIYLLPDFFSKYKIVKVNEQYLSDECVVYFEDLDYDGKSEKIVAQPRQDSKLINASYVLFNSEGDLIDQYNLDKAFVDERKVMWFRDLDNNGYKEIYIPTRSKDSSFLSIIEHTVEGSFKESEVFVDVVTPYQEDYEFKFSTDIPFEKSVHYDTELYFGITNGYSGNPRNFYKYDPIRKIIIKSPHITNVSRVAEIQDLDSDNENELLLLTHASGNTIDSTFTHRSDYSTWLTVLDNDMSFLFEPKEFKCLCSVAMTALKVNDSTKLIAQIRSRQEQEFQSKLIRLSLDGQLENETILSNNSISSNLFKISEDAFGVYEFNSGSFNIYNHELKLIKQYKLVPNLLLYHYDVDADSEDEWLGLSRTNNDIYIYRSDFKDITVLHMDFNLDANNRSKYGLKQIDHRSNQFYFQTANLVSFYDYGFNSNYSYKYPTYLGLYGLVVGILLLAVKGQKNIEAKKRNIEREISELQLKTVKNQVDPHFVFNAINTISEMTLMDNKLEADQFISRFSGFMRDTLKQSDKISTTLEEELAYTENFIKLQQTRFIDRFTYTIEVAKQVNVQSIVPKHVLYTYVENAIKHGLTNVTNGQLKIKVDQTNEYLLLQIEDNGGGMAGESTNKTTSTGSGLKIMDKIFNLYTKLYKHKIKQDLIELKDKDGTITGVQIQIRIYHSKRK